MLGDPGTRPARHMLRFTHLQAERCDAGSQEAQPDDGGARCPGARKAHQRTPHSAAASCPLLPLPCPICGLCHSATATAHTACMLRDRRDKQLS